MKTFALLLLLLVIGWSPQAEPLDPRPSKAAADSVQALLRKSLPDTNRVNLLLLAGQYFIDNANGLRTKLDRAALYAKQAQLLSAELHYAPGQIQSTYLLGGLAWAAGDEAGGTSLVQAGLTQSKQHGNRQLEAFGWYLLTYSYPRTGAGLPSIIQCCQQARALYRQAGDKRREGYMLKTIADMHLLQGNSVQALQELREVLALYHASGNKRLHYTYDLLLSAHRQMGNYEEALRYGLAAIETAKATRDTSDIRVFYWRLGFVYHELNQDGQAINSFGKGLRNAQLTHNEYYMANNAGEIARILISQKKPQQALQGLLKVLAYQQRADYLGAGAAQLVNRNMAIYLAECYLALKQLDIAEKYYKQLLSMANNEATEDLDKMFIYQGAGRFYLCTKQYDKARNYLEKALALHTLGGYLLGKADIHLLLFKVDSAQARFPAAIAHFQQYKTLKDSISTDIKNKQIATLEIQYDTKKKEQNITLLTKLGLQREFQRNAFLAGAILLTLLLGVSYNRYRLKQRSNRILESKQLEINQQNRSLTQVVSEKETLLAEKEWMLKEIHHRVKNNLQIIKSLLNLQADFLTDPVALGAMRESQNRVHAMALMHQKLYQSENMTGVGMSAYIHDIVVYLITCFNRQATVRQQVVIEPVELSVVLATPLGLIINEAVTNSLKYAFPGEQPGIITVTLDQLPDQFYRLTIADDGIGITAGVRLEQGRTLGMTMIKGLSKQLEAELTITQTNGVQISLRFEVASAPARVLSVAS